MYISNNHFIGQGIAKIVYEHPTDKNICIKFPNPKKKRSLHDIKREVSYLKKHQNQLNWVAPYIGKTETNLGTGYMYQMVRDYSGEISTPLIETSWLERKKDVEQKIIKMYQEALSHHAVINDLSSSNIYLQEKKEGFNIVLIDGFGNNNFIKIADYSKLFLRQKLNRKFTYLCKRLEIPSDFLEV